MLSFDAHRLPVASVFLVLFASHASGQLPLPDCDSSRRVVIDCPSVFPNPCFDYDEEEDCPGGWNVIPAGGPCQRCFPDLIIPGLWWEFVCRGAAEDVPYPVDWCRARQQGEGWQETLCENLITPAGGFAEQWCSESHQCIWDMNSGSCEMSGTVCRYNRALLYGNVQCRPITQYALKNKKTQPGDAFVATNAKNKIGFDPQAAQSLLGTFHSDL